MLFIKVMKGIYGLPQAGLLVNKLLKKGLNQHGYSQSKLAQAFWKHKM
jgi:hypothetical protein